MNPIGTYQGSSLGSLLHNVHANDLPPFADDSAGIIAYADDVQLYVTGSQREIHQLTRSLEQNLSTISHWYYKNGLKINAAKTQFIVLGTREMIRRIPPISVTFSGSTIACSNTVKNLGVWIDRDMSFTAHTDDVVRRCTGTLCGLSHGRHSLPQSVMATLVQGLVFSVIRYCLSVYGASNVTQRSRLQKLIRFAARVVSGRRKFDHVSDVIDERGWLHAENLYEYHRLVLVKKMLATSEPSSLADSLSMRLSVHGRDTRNSNRLVTPSIKSESGRRRFLYSAVYAYNELPQALRDLDCTRFKLGVKKHLLEKQRQP